MRVRIFLAFIGGAIAGASLCAVLVRGSEAMKPIADAITSDRLAELYYSEGMVAGAGIMLDTVNGKHRSAQEAMSARDEKLKELVRNRFKP